VACATDRIIVLDTAPTGHTLLLLDAAEDQVPSSGVGQPSAE
jgi:hypothetical protein